MTSNNLVQNTSVSAIDVTFDRDMNPTTITPAQVLSVIGPAGSFPGPYTVVANPLGTDPDPLHPRTYRIGFAAQSVSGTYTVTLASSIQSKNGDALDTNENAGVDLLRGRPRSGQHPPPRPTRTRRRPRSPMAATTFSTLTIPDSVLVQGLTVSLDITHPNDPDLEVFLIAPDGTTVELIKNAGATGRKPISPGRSSTTRRRRAIQNGAAPFSGRFQPFQPLSRSTARTRPAPGPCRSRTTWPTA